MTISSRAFYIPAQGSAPIQGEALIPEWALGSLYESSSLDSLDSVQLYSENTADISRLGHLHSAELSIVENAVPKRKSEFADARYCAHSILDSYEERGPILRGEQGMPVFPSGYCGSLSHSGSWRVALIGKETTTRESRYSLGVDIEELSFITEDVRAMILYPEEQERLHRASLSFFSSHNKEKVQNLSFTLGFSIKEAIYKAWFPRQRTFLDFKQARIQEISLCEEKHIGSSLMVGKWSAHIEVDSEFPVDSAGSDRDKGIDLVSGMWFYRPRGLSLPFPTEVEAKPLVGAVTIQKE